MIDDAANIVKGRVERFLAECANEIESYLHKLRDKREQLEDFTTVTKRFLQDSNAVEIIKSNKYMRDQLKQRIPSIKQDRKTHRQEIDPTEGELSVNNFGKFSNDTSYVEMMQCKCISRSLNSFIH